MTFRPFRDDRLAETFGKYVQSVVVQMFRQEEDYLRTLVLLAYHEEHPDEDCPPSTAQLMEYIKTLVVIHRECPGWPVVQELSIASHWPRR